MITISIVMGAFFLNSAQAVNINTQNQPSERLSTECRSSLAEHGYPSHTQSDFCRQANPNQWTCTQVILKKYHSLELAKETCLHSRTSEVNCVNQVLNRNFDPYVAKRVCKLK